MKQRLPIDTFKTVVASTPLVSMDFVVFNEEGNILLGYRNNRPAQGYWFVPGGRICKDENFENSFRRLTQAELGEAISIDSASFIGAYEHHYDDNFSGADFSTHYVVLGYQFTLDVAIKLLPMEQHSEYRWWTVDELLSSDMVHENTKAYFKNTSLR
ncbi:GDP-mannose mannosyl hydrolase [Vibrio sp. 10N.261.49.A5]|uniref:GDP-mannose mannosyl hydrolase n=1 Tax=Vibrio tasmaniensis 1F-267 TaxID=1191324 RepID=A0ABX3B1F6_9VIBR|nr:GDP-mannose mannosyl hydrolase [Vibrio tasmaniensis]OEF43740.1 GDP-mannose mannosyl hydrolase [Vibrio tasmaniensis 1F-267]